MSITIKIEKVYLLGSSEKCVNCLCSVKFRESIQIRSLTRKNFDRGKTNSQQSSNQNSDEYENELTINENEKLLSKSNESILYYLGNELKPGDFLEIECFKFAKFSKKPFGKYKMLLESLENDDPFINIDDYLVNPKTNSTISEKISFSIRYKKPILDKKTGRLKDSRDNLEKSENTLDLSDDLRYLNQKDYLHHSMNETLKTESLMDRTISNNYSNLIIKNAIGRATLSLAQLAFNPNMIIKETSDDSSSVIVDDLSLKSSSLNLNQQSPINIFFYLLNNNLFTKITSWQIKVQLIEIKNIFGNNKNVYCTVRIGDQLFKSSLKSVDKLRFNEMFTARIENLKSQKLFNKLITVSIYYKNFLKTDSLLGKFEIDFGTVYKNPTHEYYHKWGPIMPVEDQITSVGSSSGGFSTATVPKGYIKCDIIVQAKGDKVQIHKEETDKDDDIDNNMILPYGLEQPRIMIELVVNIHSACVLLKNQISNLEKFKYQLSNLKKTFTWNSNQDTIRIEDDYSNIEKSSIIEIPKKNEDDLLDDNLNLFVRVSFMGATRQTASIKSTKANKPGWNDKFTFVYFFPGLIRLFKIELCSEDTFGTKVLASEYLDMENISEYTNNGYFLPTFGPANIDMYTEPQNYRTFASSFNSKAAENLVDFNSSNHSQDFRKRSQTKLIPRSYMSVNGSSPGGGEYVARLMLSIKSFRMMGFNKKNFDQKQETLAFERLKAKKTFTLFVMISEVYMIDSRYQGELSFQLCIGTNGYEPLNKIDLNSKNLPSNFSKQQKPFKLGAKMPCYLAFDKSKPCLSLEFEIEDLRYYMYAKNFLQNSVKELIISSIKLLESNDNNIYDYYLKEILKIQKYIKSIYLSNNSITDLEKNRASQLLYELSAIVEVVQSLPDTDFSFKKLRFTQIKDSIDRLNHYLTEPFSFFPDVNIWLISDKEPIGICTIHSNDIVWSKNESEKGCICNELIYTDIKTLNLKGYENLSLENIARMRAYLWLGLKEDKDNIFKGLSQGYGLSEKYFNNIGLPTYIFFAERLTFELRCHMYQGRNLIGLDSTGLSDPYAKITIGSQSVYSNVIKQTNNPKWNSTLVIPEINIYSNYEEIVENPPELVLELYDQDIFGPDELMGKCFIRPIVQRSLTNPPKLKWYNIFFGREQAGDVLASFELLNLPPNHIRSVEKYETDSIETIPVIITPKMRSFTIEILFWGLRNIRPNNSVFVGREKIKICIQIGDTNFESNPIDKYFSNDNFLVIHKKESIDLPEEIEYKPHLNIKCLCESSFGGKQRLLGSYTVKSINDYFKDTNNLKEKYKSYIFKNRKLNHLISVTSYIDQPAENTDNNSLNNEKNKKNKEKTRKKTQSLDNENDLNLDMEYLDWWSKYYASIEEDSSEEDTVDSLTNIVQEIEAETVKNEFNEADEYESADDENENPNDIYLDSKSKKKLKKKARRKKRIRKLKKRAVKAKKIKTQMNPKSRAINKNAIKLKLKENMNKLNNNNKSNIEKIEIFETELEKVPGYSDKFDFLDTYPLSKGKNQPNNLDAIQCSFKGKFLIYKEDYALNELFEHTIFKRHGGFLKLVPPNVPIQVKVRIYIVKAFVNSIRVNGLCDPYLSIQYGDKTIEDLESCRQNTVEPIFGQTYEFDLTFPYQSQLVISVKDWESLGNKNLIGKTDIDLENRYYSNCYASCGLAKKYETNGYNRWRDILQPTQILSKLGKQWRLKKPEYQLDFINERFELKITTLDDRTIPYSLEKSPEDDDQAKEWEKQKKLSSSNPFENSKTENNPQILKEKLALMALNDWQNITGTSLVSEHVETRSLFNPETPDLEQGKVEMWIDMFSLEEINNNQLQIPKPVDILPRKPKKFQLRVIIYNTEDVILDDVNPLTGEKTSDIYVKGFICDKVNEAQSTDTHYRSMSGEGKFNWRFIFDFDYLPSEEKVVYKRKEHAFALQAIEYRMEPLITLQCWDADVVSADDFLGSIQLNLTRMIKGADTAKSCRLSMLKNKNKKTVNLFQVKNVRGWWPMAIFDGNKSGRLTGKVEAQFILLNEQQAQEKPAGLGRSEPDPLPEPNRPQDSFLWFMAPLRTFRFVIWKNYKCFIIQLIALVLFVILLIVFIFQLPSTIVNKAFSVFG